MHYIVAYDIHSDRRRRKLLDRLKTYGLPVQFSVVECDLDARSLESLKAEVHAIINPRTDRVHVYPACETCFFRTDRIGTSLPWRATF